MFDWVKLILRYGLLYFIVSIVMLVGKFEVSQSISWPDMQEKLFHEAFVAFFVAGLVTRGIESVSQREQIKRVDEYVRRISKNVWVSVYGADVPKDVADYVVAKFVHYPFCETIENVTITLKIEDEKKAESIFGIGIVRLTLDQVITVKNITDRKQDYLLEVNLENVMLNCIKKHNFEVAKYGATTLLVDGREINLEHDSDDIKAKGTFPINKGDSVKIHLIQEHLRLMHDTETWLCKNTMNEMTLAVHAPNELLVCGIPTDQAVEVLAFKDRTGKILLPRFKGRLFPGQGFILWWRPRKWENQTNSLKD